LDGRVRAATFARMEGSNITQMVYTPFADLDLLYGEVERDEVEIATPDGDEREPETVDAFNAQILAGLVSP
jgi:hypothetical protein